MSILPAEASFEERVQDVFTAYRGRGVALSALDAELVVDWAARQVPFEVVARGLRKAAEATLYDSVPGDEGLKSLRATPMAVERELKKWIDRHPTLPAGQLGVAFVAKVDEPIEVTHHKKLRSTLKKVGKTHPSFAGPLKRLSERLETPADYEAALLDEEKALLVMVRALPFAERLAIYREATERMERAEPISQAAKKESRRFHRGALLRQKLNLPNFW